MTNQTRLHKIETAVATIPRTAEQLVRENDRLQFGDGTYRRWLESLTDDEFDLLEASLPPDDGRELLQQLTDDELERVCAGDDGPLERLREQQRQA